MDPNVKNPTTSDAMAGAQSPEASVGPIKLDSAIGIATFDQPTLKKDSVEKPTKSRSKPKRLVKQVEGMQKRVDRMEANVEGLQKRVDSLEANFQKMQAREIAIKISQIDLDAKRKSFDAKVLEFFEELEEKNETNT